MKLVLVVLVLALMVGLITGGRFAGLSSLRIRLAPLAIVGLALQFLSPSRGDLPYLLLIASFLMLTVFAAVNLRTPGFPLILIGMLMNFLVIGANHGMPVTEHALIASGQQDTLTELVHDGGEKHHLAGPGDRLMFLADGERRGHRRLCGSCVRDRRRDAQSPIRSREGRCPGGDGRYSR